ncbi:type I DNA topoisomerase [Patescibacteria group bacterium]|nr:type I DNA topoisomerase [Patescibacteria group bacterium]
MAKYLVILESPGKVNKVKTFLGKNYDVVASVGHVADLPSKGLNVNIRKSFEPTYDIMPGKEKVINKIINKAKKADIVYLMTDEDREGEAISWHISRYLPENVQIKRAVTGSITKNAVLNAIENASDINMPMVRSYETRRILDRIVGYKCSYLTKTATGGKSAGRVQSAALKIFAEREKEIQNFVPEEYWQIDVDLEKYNKEKVNALLKKPNKYKIKNKKQADEICKILNDKDIIVSKYEKKDVNINPYPPFTTSTLYQSAASILGWGAKKTASMAQKLYQDGYCSYIRSDSTYIVPEFVDKIRTKIASKYDNSYMSSHINRFKNKKGSQEAHEAIRVTDLDIENVNGRDENNLYKIIWKRTVASQMAKMIQTRTKVEFSCNNKYILSATGSTTVFDGWRKVWDYGKNEGQEIPQFEKNEKVNLININKEQKFTSPPSRYNNRSIIKTLEDKGIGRPSTYSSIIETLLNRKYIEKKKKALAATEKGIRVSDYLIEANFCFIDLDFTKNMEENLDNIASENIDKTEVLNSFWTRLKEDIESAKEIKYNRSQTDYPCPKCKKNGDEGYLVLKYSKYGPFYSCSNRKEKDCDYKADVDPKTKKPIEKKKKEFEYSEHKCPNCGENFIIRTNRKGNQFLGCRNFNKDDKCKGFYDMNGDKIEFKKRKKKWKKRKKK